MKGILIIILSLIGLKSYAEQLELKSISANVPAADDEVIGQNHLLDETSPPEFVAVSADEFEARLKNGGRVFYKESLGESGRITVSSGNWAAVASGNWKVASGNWTSVASGNWTAASGNWTVASGNWTVAKKDWTKAANGNWTAKQ